MLTKIANWVDLNLKADPLLKGIEANDGIRILAVPMSTSRVSVVFQVLQADRQVRILRILFRK